VAAKYPREAGILCKWHINKRGSIQKVDSGLRSAPTRV